MKNPLKEKLKRGEAAIGTFVGLGNPDVTEFLSRLGFDWLVLDTEHSPLDFGMLQRMMQAMNGTNCVPIVRPPWNDFVVIKRVLDMGAYGVLIPWVSSKDEAVNAVRACKYPPEGVRGYGPKRAGMFDPSYYDTANEELLVAVQIETEKALRNIDDILSVEGVDACYIGPFDLSVSLGLRLPPEWDEPRLSEAFDRVLEAAQRHEKPAGTFTTLDNIEWALKKGFKFNTVDDDYGFLLRGAQMALAKVRGIGNE